MSIKVNTGFLNQSKTPLDTRQVVETLDDLLALDENIIYDGMKCYVHQNDCEYKFNSTYNETDTGHWKLIGSNDGEDLTEYVKQTELETTLEPYELADDITELTEDDIKALLELDSDEIIELTSLISDSEIRIDKTFSSSKIYQDLQQVLADSKSFTLAELSKAVGASYKVVTSTDDMTSDKVLYLLKENDIYNIYIYDADTSAVKLIGSFEVSLDDFYTKTESEDLFATKVDVVANYATKTEISNTYATKEELTDAIDNATSDGTDLTQFAKVSDLEDGTITVENSKKLNGLTKDELFVDTNSKIEEINNNLSYIGNVYNTEINITNPMGEWAIGARLELSNGTYIIFRRGYSLTESIIIGKGYSIGDYVSSIAKEQSATYIEVQKIDTPTTICNFIFANSDIYNDISAVRIG